MTEIINPHDKFFKEVFSRREVAVDFLRNYLPADIFACLDEESIYLRKDSFVDKELATYFSDLLYHASLKDGADSYVYVLFEHKSYPEPLIAFHLLRYMVKIWEQDLKQGFSGRLSSVIPIVIYHGPARWKVDERFISLFNCPETLRCFLPDFTYALCDISCVSDDEIKGIVILKSTLLLLKYILRDELRDQLPKILGLLGELTGKKTGMEYLETVLTYVSRGTDSVDEEDVRRAVKEAFPVIGGEIMPTLAEKWIKQGMQQGIQQGIQQGMQQGMQQGFLEALRGALIEVLEDRFETVSQTLRNKLKNIKDPDVLKSLHKKALKAASLEDFKEAVRISLI